MPLSSPTLTKFTTASPLLASFSYNDIITNQGVISFDLYLDHDGTDIGYKMSPAATTSNVEYINYAGASSGGTYDFYSTEFGKGVVINGTASLSIAASGQHDSSTGTTYFTGTFYKYDGTTSTSIGTFTSETKTFTTSSTSVVYVMPIELTRTNFNIGDSIRLNLVVHKSTPSFSFSIYPDPHRS